MFYGALPPRSPREAARAPVSDAVSLLCTQPTTQQRGRVALLQNTPSRRNGSRGAILLRAQLYAGTAIFFKSSQLSCIGENRSPVLCLVHGAPFPAGTQPWTQRRWWEFCLYNEYVLINEW